MIAVRLLRAASFLAVTIAGSPLAAEPLRVGTYEIAIAPSRVAGPTGSASAQLLSISRGGRPRYFIRDQSVEIAYARKSGVGGEHPDLIVSTFGGGAHCCFTIHALRLGARISDEIIPIADAEPGFDLSIDPPLLRFADFNFAYWNASFASSPAPAVVLSWDLASHSYQPDLARMRRVPPDAASLAAKAAALRADLAGKESPGPALWREMLDLIYSGNAAAARSFFDQAWPPGLGGKTEFLTAFRMQLTRGALWRRYRLGALLEAEPILD